ncbi:MAG: Txe/YoeB family addiction module toxin [Dysgonamonadaceae bacterium]|jgi:Txe/YoeB family toxin of toxin-antitoxin system|nr:Txe/YoeB family addiction module toxin [Dysgonamonadaceae bacterium]
MWTVEFTNTALKQKEIAFKSVYKSKIKELVDIISVDPFQNPPPYEKLQPPRDNKYSRRINKRHCLVYEVIATENYIRILSMWSHYEA